MELLIQPSSLKTVVLIVVFSKWEKSSSDWLVGCYVLFITNPNVIVLSVSAHFTVSFLFSSLCLIWRGTGQTCTTACGGDGRIWEKGGVTWPRWSPNMSSTTQRPTCLMRSKSRPGMSLERDLSLMWPLDTPERTVSRDTMDMCLGKTEQDQCHQWIFSL